MRYQKLHSHIWNDEKFVKLSHSEQRIFIYFISSPHSNSLGCYVLKKGYATEDLTCSWKTIERALRSLEKYNFLLFDRQTNLLLIKKHLKHNPISNTNCIKSVIKIINSLPYSYRMMVELSKIINELPENKDNFKQALTYVINKRLTNTEEQEQEQVEEHSNPLCVENDEKGKALLEKYGIKRPELWK